MSKWLVLDQPAGSELVRLTSGRFLRLQGGVPIEVADLDAERLLAAYRRVKPTTAPAKSGDGQNQIDEATEGREPSPAPEPEVDPDPLKHEFNPDRSGVHCIDCERVIADHRPPPPTPKAKRKPRTKKAAKSKGAITPDDLTAGGRRN